MKHLLNNLTENEKNAIREQHEGGMKVNTKKFKSLLESKSGSVKPLISERFTKELIDKIIQMDKDFNNDPTYVEYEKKYAFNKFKNMMKENMGIDDVPDEMVEMMFELASGISKQEITPETVVLHKDGVINTVTEILNMAEEDGKIELVDKLNTFIGLLEQI